MLLHARKNTDSVHTTLHQSRPKPGCRKEIPVGDLVPMGYLGGGQAGGVGAGPPELLRADPARAAVPWGVRRVSPLAAHTPQSLSMVLPGAHS